MISESSLLTSDGRQAEIQTMAQQMIEQQDVGPVINIVPVISSDRSAIDITLQAGIREVVPRAR